MRPSTLLFALTLFACGGDAPAEEAPPPLETSGDEAEGQYIDDEPMEDEFTEPAVPTGPGQVHAVIRMGNEEREGTFSIRSPQGDVIAEGRAGETLTVPSGTYRAVGMLEESLMPGHIEREEGVTVTPGETTEVEFRYEVARVRLNVRRNGRPVRAWRITLTREGREHEVTMSPSREHVMMPPGRYSGVLTTGGRRIEVTGLIFQGGATMDVPVNIE